MKKEQKETLVSIIEGHREVLFKKARNNEPIDYGYVDSMLAWLAREIKNSSIRIKLDKQ